jgi:hypothetical protein
MLLLATAKVQRRYSPRLFLQSPKEAGFSLDEVPAHVVTPS